MVTIVGLRFAPPRLRPTYATSGILGEKAMKPASTRDLGGKTLRKVLPKTLASTGLQASPRIANATYTFQQITPPKR